MCYDHGTKMVNFQAGYLFTSPSCLEAKLDNLQHGLSWLLLPQESLLLMVWLNKFKDMFIPHSFEPIGQPDFLHLTNYSALWRFSLSFHTFPKFSYIYSKCIIPFSRITNLKSGIISLRDMSKGRSSFLNSFFSN